MKIEFYRFGQMIIDGKKYTSDLKIIKGEIIPNWWRKQGHLLQIEDLQDIIDAKPHTLVVGTGANDLMRLAPNLATELGKLGIRLEAISTALAMERFNELIKLQGLENIAGAFHLTC